MITLKRTDCEHPDFKSLVKQLDAYLVTVDGDEHDFYHQYNHIDDIKYVVLAIKDDLAVGCGAIKEFDRATMEIKRMFVEPPSRGHGIAAIILTELENWATELGFERCVLETGSRQAEAIALYQKGGYQRISNYGQYAGVENSNCFEKKIELT